MDKKLVSRFLVALSLIGAMAGGISSSVAQAAGSNIVEAVQAESSGASAYVAVEDVSPFPVEGGEAVFEPGTAAEEVFSYAAVDLESRRLVGLTRTAPLAHASGSFVASSVPEMATPPPPTPTQEPEATPAPSEPESSTSTDEGEGLSTQVPCELVVDETCPDAPGGLSEDLPDSSCEDADDDPPICVNEDLPGCNSDASCKPILPRACPPAVEPCHPLPWTPIAFTLEPEHEPLVAIALPDMEEPPDSQLETGDLAPGSCKLPAPFVVFDGAEDQEGIAFGTFFFSDTAECDMKMESISIAAWIHRHDDGAETTDAGGCSNGDTPCKMAVASGSHHCDLCEGSWQAHATAVFELRRGKAWGPAPNRCDKISKRIISCHSRTKTREMK